MNGAEKTEKKKESGGADLHRKAILREWGGPRRTKSAIFRLHPFVGVR